MTLVYSAHDEEHNDAVVLRGLLLGTEREAARSPIAGNQTVRARNA